MIKIILHNKVCIAIGCRLTVFKWDSTPNSKLNHLVSMSIIMQTCLYKLFCESQHFEANIVILNSDTNINILKCNSSTITNTLKLT